jgi:hypothetical protein
MCERTNRPDIWTQDLMSVSATGQSGEGKKGQDAALDPQGHSPWNHCFKVCELTRTRPSPRFLNPMAPGCYLKG